MTGKLVWALLLPALACACLTGCDQPGSEDINAAVTASVPESTVSAAPAAEPSTPVTAEPTAPATESATASQQPTNATPAADPKPAAQPVPAETAVALAPDPLGRKPVAPARPRALKPKSDGPEEITFDDIKLEIGRDDRYEPEHTTSKVQELQQQRVRIRGFILPTFQQTGIKQFVLVRDNLECCFGPGAALYDCIVVDMLPEKSATFSLKPVSVEGTFSIREWPNPEDPKAKQMAIYHLDGETVK
jgi:hypothetical protein